MRAQPKWVEGTCTPLVAKCSGGHSPGKRRQGRYMRETSHQVRQLGQLEFLLEFHARSLYFSLFQEDDLILLFQKSSILYMNLAGSRLPPGSNKHRCKGKCHFRATFRRPQSFQRNEQQTFTDTRMFFFFSLSQEEWLVVVFKTVHFTVHFFSFLAKKIGVYILTTGVLLSKTPSQKHDKHKRKYIRVSCHNRAQSS